MDDREAARICAERVMGWHIVDVEENAATGFATEYHWSDGEHLIVSAENYNPRQNIAQAVELIETWRRGEGRGAAIRMLSDGWYVTVADGFVDGFVRTHRRQAPTLATAITNAVLAALEKGGDL